MPHLRTTIGQLALNEALPEEMRDYGRIVDRKGAADLFRTLAQNHPEQYAEVSKKLADLGHRVSTETGGYSFGPEHMRKAKASEQIGKEIQKKLERILANDNLSGEQRKQLIIRTVGSYQQRQIDEVYDESSKEKNPLASQIMSGSRGNKTNLSSLRGSDLLYADHHDNVIPLPVLRSYSQGLDAPSYWAGTYGARRGVMAVKFATQEAGYLSKQLNQVAHRLIVTDHDDPREFDQPRGLPVNVDDMDNEGALLAHDVGSYKKNTVLSPKILKDLKAKGKNRILVRSPLVGGSPEGGLYARDVGVREEGTLPGRGTAVGLLASQALSEPLAQAQLAAKHGGGIAGQDKAVGGFHAINQLIQVPGVFKGGAAHANVDGKVDRIEEAPAGGQYVTIGGEQHYVGRGFGLKVKRGDEVEAGDVLSEGQPNPWQIVHHKGVGEGRRYFVDAMHSAYKSAGLKVHRRNLEVLSRGLINHVRLTEETDHHVPDDVVPYSTLEHTYEPRDGAQDGHPRRLLGHYLERPVLHYTIGTKIRPSIVNELAHFGVDKVTAHPEPPPFQAEMIRGMASLHHDPDFMTRMYGSGLKGSLLDAVHHGGTSNELGTSFVPGLSRAVDFGRVGLVHTPEPGIKPDQPLPTGKPIHTDAPVPAKEPKKKSTGWMSLFKFSADKKRWTLSKEKRADSQSTPRPPDPNRPPQVPGASAPQGQPAAAPHPAMQPPRVGQPQTIRPQVYNHVDDGGGGSGMTNLPPQSGGSATTAGIGRAQEDQTGFQREQGTHQHQMTQLQTAIAHLTGRPLPSPGVPGSTGQGTGIGGGNRGAPATGGPSPQGGWMPGTGGGSGSDPAVSNLPAPPTPVSARGSLFSRFGSGAAIVGVGGQAANNLLLRPIGAAARGLGSGITAAGAPTVGSWFSNLGRGTGRFTAGVNSGATLPSTAARVAAAVPTTAAAEAAAATRATAAAAESTRLAAAARAGTATPAAATTAARLATEAEAARVAAAARATAAVEAKALAQRTASLPGLAPRAGRAFGSVFGAGMRSILPAFLIHDALGLYRSAIGIDDDNDPEWASIAPVARAGGGRVASPGPVAGQTMNIDPNATGLNRRTQVEALRMQQDLHTLADTFQGGDDDIGGALNVGRSGLTLLGRVFNPAGNIASTVGSLRQIGSDLGQINDMSQQNVNSERLYDASLPMRQRTTQEQIAEYERIQRQADADSQRNVTAPTQALTPNQLRDLANLRANVISQQQPSATQAMINAGIPVGGGWQPPVENAAVRAMRAEAARQADRDRIATTARNLAAQANTEASRRSAAFIAAMTPAQRAEYDSTMASEPSVVRRSTRRR